MNTNELFDDQGDYRFTSDQRAELERLWELNDTEGYEGEWFGLDGRGVTSNALTQQLITQASTKADGSPRIYVPGSRRVLAPTREKAAPIIEFGVRPFRIADAEAVHREMRHTAYQLARKYGMYLGFLSLPLTTPPEGIVTTPQPRPQRFDAEYRKRGRAITSAGEQPQAGTFEDLDEMVKVVNFVAPWIHVLMALSACAPIHEGGVTGYQSYRPSVFANAPTVGVRENFVDWNHYEADTRKILNVYGYADTGDISELTLVSHDWIRPTRFGGIEFRVPDVSPSIVEPSLWSFLGRALVHIAREELRQDYTNLPLWPTTLKHHAMFQAARDGCSGGLVDPYTGRMMSADVVVKELLDLTESWLKDFGVLNRVRFVGDSEAQIPRRLCCRRGMSLSFSSRWVESVVTWTHATREVLCSGN